MKLEISDYKNIGKHCENAYNNLFSVFKSLAILNKNWDISKIILGKEDCLINYVLFLSNMVSYLGNIEVNRKNKINFNKEKIDQLSIFEKNIKECTDAFKNIDCNNANINNLISCSNSLRNTIEECKISIDSLENDKIIINENIIQLKNHSNTDTLL